MTRETKVGLIVAGSFLCLVCIVVVSKMGRGTAPAGGSEESQQRVAAVEPDKDAKKPKAPVNKESPAPAPPNANLLPGTNPGEPLSPVQRLENQIQKDGLPGLPSLAFPPLNPGNGVPPPPPKDIGIAPAPIDFVMPAPTPGKATDNSPFRVATAPQQPDATKKPLDNVPPTDFSKGVGPAVEPPAQPVKKDNGFPPYPPTDFSKGVGPAVEPPAQPVRKDNGFPPLAPAAVVGFPPPPPDGKNLPNNAQLTFPDNSPPTKFPQIPVGGTVPVPIVAEPAKQSFPSVAEPTKSGIPPIVEPNKVVVTEPAKIGFPPVPESTKPSFPPIAPPTKPSFPMETAPLTTAPTFPPIPKSSDTAPVMTPSNNLFRPEVSNPVPTPTIPTLSTPPITIGKLPAVKTTDPERVEVRPGETNFTALSKRFYSDEKYADALQAYNHDHSFGVANGENLKANPPRLNPGQQVIHPPLGVLERDYRSLVRAPELNPIAPVVNVAPPVKLTSPMPLAPSVAPPIGGAPVTINAPTADRTRSYVVQNPAGERLRDIAERLLGDPNRWPAIYRLNNVQPQFPIPAGTSLRLPVD